MTIIADDRYTYATLVLTPGRPQRFRLLRATCDVEIRMKDGHGRSYWRRVSPEMAEVVRLAIVNAKRS